MKAPKKRVAACVQGIACGLVLLDTGAVPDLMERSALDESAVVRVAFQTGLICGLLYCEWMAPGIIASRRSSGPLEDLLLTRAACEAEASRARGYPLPFDLEHALG